MRPAPYLALAIAVLSGLFAASRAQAQAISGNMTIRIDGGKALKNGSNVFIDREQCLGSWKIDLQGYSVSVPYLELWATNNQATNCADQANRNSQNTSNTICWGPIATQNQINGKTSFTVEGPKLFSRDAFAGKSGASCDLVKGTKYKFQFVTLDAPTQPGTATVTASNGNPNQVSAILTLYSEVPDPPQNPAARSGGRTLGIEWTKINNDPLTEYRAYFDHAPEAPQVLMDGGLSEFDGGVVTCGTGLFDDQRLADGGVTRPTGSSIEDRVDGEYVFRSGKTKGSSISIGSLESKGIDINTFTSVSVAAIDGAGNIGELSAPVCVRRVNTVGYLGLCKDAGIDCGELETCSLSSRNTGSAFWLSVGTLALSAWARRRRRSN
ncbi:MAG: hypothetical protein ABW352_12500 [Polyangiales bacterium]